MTELQLLLKFVISTNLDFNFENIINTENEIIEKRVRLNYNYDKIVFAFYNTESFKRIYIVNFDNND